mmetsp:Transcript_57566/g.140592  ORF Transcript_57566/g.140592 Transcript_57566/m.140592 type:complete len:229 (-) Transcript_57566:117-803(-)
MHHGETIFFVVESSSAILTLFLQLPPPHVSLSSIASMVKYFPSSISPVVSVDSVAAAAAASSTSSLSSSFFVLSSFSPSSSFDDSDDNSNMTSRWSDKARLWAACRLCFVYISHRTAIDVAGSLSSPSLPSLCDCCRGEGPTRWKKWNGDGDKNPNDDDDDDEEEDNLCCSVNTARTTPWISKCRFRFPSLVRNSNPRIESSIISGVTACAVAVAVVEAGRFSPLSPC